MNPNLEAALWALTALLILPGLLITEHVGIRAIAGVGMFASGFNAGMHLAAAMLAD